MAKKKKKEIQHTQENAAETPEQKSARLERELNEMRAAQEELQAKLETAQPNLTDSEAQYFKDMDFIRKHGRNDANKIQLKEITDHKNISLWTKLGKRIGPSHPDNARQTYERFWRNGVKLLVQKPSEEQIEAYKQTDEYKQWKKKFDENRARKNRSRRKGETERILGLIAQMSGKSVNEIHNIKKPEEIESLAAGRQA